MHKTIFLLVEYSGHYEDYQEEVLAASFSRESFDKRVEAREAEQKDRWDRTYLVVRDCPFEE